MSHLRRPGNGQGEAHRDRSLISIVGLATTLVLWLMSDSTLAGEPFRHTVVQTDQIEQPRPSLTPPPGSQERRAILDALRGELTDLVGPDLVFVVEHLKVYAGWAWIHAFPQSRDGGNQYEDVSALLRKQGGRWRLQHLESGGEGCSEEPDPEACPDPATRFPAAPREIFTPDGTSARIAP
jgi:hypothetical protein